jgi:plasmid stabilization system protein ParE
MSTIIKRPDAKRDLDGHAAYLGRDNPRVAIRFLEAAERAFASRASMPGMGGRWEGSAPEFADLRVWPIRGFKKY